jgi:A49-like RNA polymerase I associated factor
MGKRKDKQVVVDDDDGRVKVRKVWNKDGESLEPFKIHFEHGELLGDQIIGSRDLREYFTGHLYSGPSRRKSSCLSNPGSSTLDSLETGSGTTKVVTLENESMMYMGSTEGDLNQTTKGASLKTYIVIKSKKKNKSRLNLYETTPITVSPFIKGLSYTVEKEKDTSVKKTLAEMRTATQELAREFGSKKKRLYLERLEKNRVTDMNDSIMSAAADAKLDDVPIILKDESILQLVPPCKRDAGQREDVYNLSDILTREDLNDLEETAVGCLESTPEDIKYWKENNT